MAYTQGLCSALQANINEVAGTNAPAMARQKVGMIDALMSDVNRMGFTADIVPTNGKFRAVQINWIGQACDNDVNTDCTSDCVNDVTPAPSQTLITDFNCAKYKMGFDESDMRKLCEADSVWVAQNIMRAMNAINVSVDKALLALANTNAGVTSQGNSSLSLPLYTSSGAPNPLAWAQIKAEMDAQGATGSPLIVGGGSMDIYARAMQIACCNTNFGVDLSRASGDGYFYNDTFAPATLNGSLAFAPGAAQLITWNKYLGDYAKRNDNFEHGTIVDPFTGLTYDLKTSYDDCAEKWFVELALNWAWFQVPAAYCAQLGDNNLMVRVEDCSAGPVVCP